MMEGSNGQRPNEVKKRKPVRINVDLSKLVVKDLSEKHYQFMLQYIGDCFAGKVDKPKFGRDTGTLRGNLR